MQLPQELQYLINSKRELADGMKDVFFQKHNWGFEISWLKSPLITNNLLIIIENELFSAHEKNNSENHQSHIILLNSQKKQNETEKSLIFLRRKVNRVKAPFSPEYSIRKFSFDTRDLRIDSRRMSKALSNMVSKDLESTIEVERFIGGILHILNGTIWVLEDPEENILASILVGSENLNDYLRIELFGILENFKESNLIYLLLGNILEFYSNVPIFAEVLNDTSVYKILLDYDFEITNELNLLKK